MNISTANITKGLYIFLLYSVLQTLLLSSAAAGPTETEIIVKNLEKDALPRTFLRSYAKSDIGINSNIETFQPDNEDNHQQCLVAIQLLEQRYKLPEHLLFSLSIIESGKWSKKYSKILPWPWVLNVDGETHFFDNKMLATKFLLNIVKNGLKNVDVGCLQVSVKHHGHKFKNLEEMLDPIKNVSYAAKYVAENYAETNNWKQAVAYYHSRTPSIGKEYLNKVMRVWQKIGISAKNPNKHTDTLNPRRLLYTAAKNVPHPSNKPNKNQRYAEIFVYKRNIERERG